MPLYRVTWEIDLEAESAIEAAQKALEIQRDFNSTANVFAVEDYATGWNCEVDLQETKDESPRVET